MAKTKKKAKRTVASKNAIDEAAKERDVFYVVDEDSDGTVVNTFDTIGEAKQYLLDESEGCGASASDIRRWLETDVTIIRGKLIKVDVIESLDLLFEGKLYDD